MDRPLLAAGVLLGAFLLQAGALAWRTGTTYDEPPHIAAGFVYRQSGLGFFTREHPPLTDYLRGLAITPLGPSPAGPPPGVARLEVNPHQYGQLFLFRNRVPALRLLRVARSPSVLLGGLLALAVWWWARRAAGEAAALFALAFLAFEPNLLAHSGLATTDAGAAAFFVLALAGWAVFLDGGRLSAAAAAGVAAGAAMASKATGSAALPVMALALAWGRGRRLPDRRDLLGLAAAAGAAAAVVLLVYGPSDVGRFLDMLRYRAGQMRLPTPVYLFGRSYREGNALYFPAVLLLKTTIPLLVLAAWAALRREEGRPALERRVILAGMAVVLGAALAGRRQSGVRYVLVLYPLMCLLAGGLAARWWSSKGTRWRAAAAVLWHAASSLAAFPHTLAYANELAGGRAYRALGDSNLDWGQVAPDLKRFMDARGGGLILAYFGLDCPRERGLAYQEAFGTPNFCPGEPELLPVDLDREWLAISATKWQGFYESAPPAWSWLRSRAPVAAPGGAVLVFDVSQDADAHRRLAAMYEANHLAAAASRERARAAFIEARAPRT